MKKMTYACVVLGMVLSLPVFASEWTPNIQKGNYETAGWVSFADYMPDNGNPSSTFNLSTSTQYFVKDHVAVGGSFRFAHSFGTVGTTTWNSFGIGPSAKYYFWTMDRLGAYVDEAITYNTFTGTPHYWDSTTSFGLNNFLTPSVAFGPKVQLVRMFPPEGGRGATEVVLAGAFTIAL